MIYHHFLLLLNIYYLNYYNVFIFFLVCSSLFDSWFFRIHSVFNFFFFLNFFFIFFKFFFIFFYFILFLCFNFNFYLFIYFFFFCFYAQASSARQDEVDQNRSKFKPLCLQMVFNYWETGVQGSSERLSADTKSGHFCWLRKVQKLRTFCSLHPCLLVGYPSF